MFVTIQVPFMCVCSQTEHIDDVRTTASPGQYTEKIKLAITCTLHGVF